MREEPWRPAELKDFLRRLRPIFDGGFGGALLAQFPHSFHLSPENMEYLKELVSQIKEAYPNDCRGARPCAPTNNKRPQPSARSDADGRRGTPVVVEVRHLSWNSPEAFSAFEELGASICSIDQPMFRGSLGPLEQVTGGMGYIRLHGRNKANWFNENAGRDDRYNYLYPAKELKPWVERVRRMAEKARDVYVIANNHFRGQAVCNALMFKTLLEGRRVRAPATLMENYPVLKEYADPDVPMQETLF